MPRGTSQDCCCQCPHACGEPLLTCASTGDPATVADSFGSVSCGVLVHARFCLCPPCLESLFSPVLWKSYNQISLACKVRFPGDSQSLCQIPRLGSLMSGSEPSQQWENFFGIIALQFVGHSPSGYGIWFLSWLHPSYCLPAAFFFFGRFQHPPVDGCSADSCNFGALSGGDEHTSFCSTILNWKPARSYSSILMDLRSNSWLTLLPFPPHSSLIYCIVFFIFFSLWCIIDHFFWPIFQYMAFFYSDQLADKIIYCNFHFTYYIFLSLESVWFLFKYIISLFIPYSLLFKNLSFIILNCGLNCFKIRMRFPCLECECVAALCCFPDTDSWHFCSGVPDYHWLVINWSWKMTCGHCQSFSFVSARDLGMLSAENHPWVSSQPEAHWLTQTLPGWIVNKQKFWSLGMTVTESSFCVPFPIIFHLLLFSIRRHSWASLLLK